MVFVLAGFIALGTWFTIQDELWDRQPRTFDAPMVNMKVYVPIEPQRRCRNVGDGPVFRDLNPPSP